MSERILTANVKAELAKANIQLALFVELIFDSGALRMWSGVGSFTLLGNVYTGVGNFGGIDRIEENAGDTKATGMVLTLSGIPSSLIATCLTEKFQGRPASIWLGLFDSSWALINDPVKIFKGRMDYPLIEEGGETATISVYVESLLIDLERPRVRRYTNEDQAELYPGDTLAYVAGLQNRDIVWKSE